MIFIICAIGAGMILFDGRDNKPIPQEEAPDKIEGALDKYVPLKLYFMQAYDSHLGEGILSGDGLIYLFYDNNGVSYWEDSAPGPRLGVVKGTALTPEQWKGLYDLCESTDIWGLGEGTGEFLPEISYTYADGFSWRLVVEYPGKHLDVEGRRIWVFNEADMIGCVSQNGNEVLIAENLVIAREYPKLQEIFRYLYELAVPETYLYHLLGEDRN